MALWDWFRLDGIQDDELLPGSDWVYLTPMERIGVQSLAEAELARRLIEQRKREFEESANAAD